MPVKNGVQVRPGRGPLTKQQHSWLEEKILLFQTLIGQPALELCWKQASVVGEIFDRCAREGLRRLEAATGLGTARIVTLIHFRDYLPLDQWVEGVAVDFHLTAAYHHGVAVNRHTLKRVQEGGKTPHDWLVLAKASGCSLERFESDLGLFYGNISGGSMLALDVEVRRREYEAEQTAKERGATVPATPPILSAVKEDLKEWRERTAQKRVERKRQEEISLTMYESVIESVGRFVRTLTENFQPRRRNALERERIFERLEQLHREDLPKVLQERVHLAATWGPNGFCVICGKKDHPHEAMGYCTKCLKAAERKGTPAIKQYLRHHPRPKKRG